MKDFQNMLFYVYSNVIILIKVLFCNLYYIQNIGGRDRQREWERVGERGREGERGGERGRGVRQRERERGREGGRERERERGREGEGEGRRERSETEREE